MERPELREFVGRVSGLRARDVLEEAARELCGALDAGGVEYVLLKGPALTRAVYLPGEHRGYTDVDVLVAPAHLPTARRVLADLGYRNFSERRGIEDVAGVVHADVWSQGNEAIGPQMVDLHHQLAGVEAPAEVAWRALAAHRTRIDLGGRSVAVLDPAGLAFQLATHAAQHGPDGLVPLADLRRGLERLPLEVWRAASELAGELQATEAFSAGLRLLPAGADLAERLGLPATPGLDWQILHRDTRPRGSFHLQALAEAQGMRARLGVVRRALWPKREWLLYEHPWAVKSAAGIPAARAVHVLRAPVWAVRAWQFRRQGRRAAG